MIAEMKSRGKDLDKAFTQATEYFEGIKENDLPKYRFSFGLCAFSAIRSQKKGRSTEFPIEDFPDKIHYFGFISGYEKREYAMKNANIKIKTRLISKSPRRSANSTTRFIASGYAGHKLEVFLVRLVYCLFADDTGIFPKDHFRFFLEEKTAENGSNVGAMIGQVFEILDTAPDRTAKHH